MKNNNIQGVPRLSEIINASKVIKTPSLEVYLQDGISKDKIKAKHVQSGLECCYLSKVVEASEIVYDPDLLGTVVEADKTTMAVYMSLPDEEEETLRQASPWVLRILVSREMLVDKGK